MPQRETRSAVPATTCRTQKIVPCTRGGRNGGEGGGAVCCQSSPLPRAAGRLSHFQAPLHVTFPRISTASRTGPQTYTLRCKQLCIKHFLKALLIVTHIQIKAYSSHIDTWAFAHFPKCISLILIYCTLTSWGGGSFWGCKTTFS